MFTAFVMAVVLMQGQAPAVSAPEALDEDPIAISEEMKDFLAARVAPALGPLDRLQLLVNLIFRDPEIRFSYDATTSSAAETFRRRSGNCLSYTNMLVAMARELGLRVHFREVEVPPTWTLQGRVVVMSSHVNVLAQIGGHNYVVDLFPELNRVTFGGRVISDQRARAHFLSNIGAEHLANGRNREAVELYRKALEHDSEVDFVWVNLGVALSISGEFQEAERAYRHALRISPENSLALSNLGRLYERMGDQQRAAAYEEKALKFRLRNPYYHYRLGEAALKEGHWDAAVIHFRRALDRKSEEHHFHFGLAQAYWNLGQVDKALRELEAARRFATDPTGEERYRRKLETLAARH